MHLPVGGKVCENCFGRNSPSGGVLGMEASDITMQANAPFSGARARSAEASAEMAG